MSRDGPINPRALGTYPSLPNPEQSTVALQAERRFKRKRQYLREPRLERSLRVRTGLLTSVPVAWAPPQRELVPIDIIRLGTALRQIQLRGQNNISKNGECIIKEELDVINFGLKFIEGRCKSTDTDEPRYISR
jgi:hypothetical protein